MNPKRVSLLLIFAAIVSSNVTGQDERLQWWREARFGMFIHWGPVSLRGTEIGWSRGAQVPLEEYDLLHESFNPMKFDADEWARIAKQAGMKYMVLTSKHHDGFCLWDSRTTDYDIMSTPFKRDVVKELSEACKRHGLAFGTYYSILDWHHPDYPLGSPGGKTKKPDPDIDRYEQYMHDQLRELAALCDPLRVFWFDGEWESPWTFERGERLHALCRKLSPTALINNRVGKDRQGMGGTTKQDSHNPGDFDTPEQSIGAFSTDRPWESCMTICRQWAWKPNDHLKSLTECLQTLIRVICGDGNLLFNVGPMPDGRIEPRQVERLKEMGNWLEGHGESLYGTRGGPFKPGMWGASTHSGKRIYVHVLDWLDDALILPPVDTKILGASLLTGGEVSCTQSPDGITLAVAKEHRNDIDTIVVLELDGNAADISPVGLASLSLALFKPARASNVFENNFDRYGPANAFDDNDSTRWATDFGTEKVWLEVDLGEPQTFSRVIIREAYEGRVQKFELQCKENGEWQTVYRGGTLGKNAVCKFEPITAQNVRLEILEATEGPTIREFLVLR